MPVWTEAYQTLMMLHGSRLSHWLAPWEPTLLLVLLLALAYLILVEDWRLALLAWAIVGLMVGGLLVALLPVPWALSRTVAAGLDGALLWIGARRWPHPRRGRYQGCWLRGSATLVLALAAFQLRAYVHQFWLEPVQADAVLALLLAALLLLALHGTPFHGTLGLLLLLHAGTIVLAPLLMPRTWLYLLTLLDLALATAGSMAVASEGLWVRKRALGKEQP